MAARNGARQTRLRSLLALGLVATLAVASAHAQPGGRRGPGGGAGPGAGPGGGRGPGGPSLGGPGGPGIPGAPGIPGVPAVPGVPVPGAEVPGTAPRPPVPLAPAAPAAVALPQQPAGVPQAARPAVAGPPPFTAEWYAQHPDAWQHPKPYAEWRSAPVPPATVVSAFFGTDGGANPNLTSITAVEWLSLGVFASPARVGGPPTVLQQLAVSKAGQVKGVMVDTASNAVQPISGMADVLSGKVTWSVGQAGGIGYETTLDELLKQAPAVTAATPAGRQPATLALVPAK